MRVFAQKSQSNRNNKRRREKRISIAAVKTFSLWISGSRCAAGQWPGFQGGVKGVSKRGFYAAVEYHSGGSCALDCHQLASLAVKDSALGYGIGNTINIIIITIIVSIIIILHPGAPRLRLYFVVMTEGGCGKNKNQKRVD